MAHLLPDALRALLSARAYPHPVETIEFVETHVSWIVLTGAFAYKIKRPVHYAFIDLRSLERRAFFCREELRLNRRFAAELYVDVCEITARDGEARIGGGGDVIEYAVRMKQFQREDELDRLLAAGRIEPLELEAFGRALADIHARLPVAAQQAPWGRPDAVRSQMLENLEQLIRSATYLLGGDSPEEMRAVLAARIDQLAPVLSHRLATGCVRECHGDLHTRNIVRRHSRLVAFDCMEFEPAFRWIDVAEEVAFLLADLRAQGCPAHGHAFLGGYLAQSGDYEAARVLDLYAAHRALIRAKVTALGAAGNAAPDGARRQVRAYIDTARAALERKRPLLVLMSGLSGSGKTWLATRIAPTLGAIHLRSDVERKRRAGLAESARSGSAPEQGLYSRQTSAAVYEQLAASAEHVLAGGHTIIVDATFARREDRARFRELAARLGVNLRLIHCHAPPDVLRDRVAQRHARGTDASEADLTVLHWQEQHVEPIQADEGLTIFDVDSTGADCAPPFAGLVRALRAAAD